ncbi:MAG: SigE family RNA polymerase sigma factor [Propionibacteriaceae bacterium]|nr:SigE family RNA polymerase sigma factor [Propionibacteriaceae bacterium]
MSFDAYVVASGPGLWRAAFLLTGDRHKAEDLVQTVLAKCFGKYRGNDQQFDAYVRKAIYHTYVSWWRRHWNAEDPTEALPEQQQTPADAEVSLDVLRALATLPKMQRAVLVLRYFEDRSVQDTARILGISEGTVKSHATRGCAALRSCVHLKEAA